MAKELKSKVTKALRETVANNDHIEHVHFTADGNHYFNVHEYKAEPKDVKGAANDGNYGRVDIKYLQDEQGKLTAIKTPMLKTKIVETATREQILDSETVSNLTLSSALLSTLSSEEQAEIAKILSKSKRTGTGSSVVSQ